MARVITLVLVLRHSNENHSMPQKRIADMYIVEHECYLAELVILLIQCRIKILSSGLSRVLIDFKEDVRGCKSRLLAIGNN